MPHSGQNSRFQVLVNGEVRGTVGLEAIGVLTAIISWVRRDPATIPDDVLSAPDFAGIDWAGERIDIEVGGLDSVTREHYKWLEIELTVGDEVTVRVLPPGDFDPPTRREPVRDSA